MRALILARDWSATPLGVPSDWPQPLQTLVDVMLGSNQPMFVVWGPEHTLLYNDAYAEILATKHPVALGSDFLDVWSEIRADLLPVVEQAYGGRPVQMDDIQLTMERKGYSEETHFSFSYTPVRDQNGAVAGFFCPCVETTGQVLAERRRTADAERQRRLFEQAPGFITILSGPEHVFEFCNAAYRRLIGGRQAVGRTVREVLPELESQGFFELLDRVFQTGERFVAERSPIVLGNPDGLPEERFLDFIYEPAADETGHITGVFVEGHDVTERVLAEAGLREAEERYRALFSSIEQGFCTIEVAFDSDDKPIDYRFLEVSPSFERQTGIENGAGRWMREIAVDQDQHWFDIYGRVALTGEPARFEEYSTPLGRWWDVYAFRISGERRIAVLFRDITDQKRSEAALRESDARFRLMADAVPQIVWITDRSGRMEFLNRRFVEYTGAPYGAYEPAEMAAAFIHAEDGAKVVAAFDAALATGKTFEVEHRIRSKEGEDRWFLARAEPYRDPTTGEIIRWFGASVDIHDRKLAEEKLRKLNGTLDRQVAERTAQLRRYQDIVEATAAAICAFDTDYRLIAFNRAHNAEFRRVNGFDTKLGDVFPDLFVPEQGAAMRALMSRALSGESFTVTKGFGRPELGTPVWEITYTPLKNDAGEIVGAFHHAMDISSRLVAEAELQATQEALRQSQKMEAMGSLTGGVAHDFNNLLTPIIGSLDMLVRKGIGSERERRLIEGALQSAERAKTLVQRLLAFARRQPLQPVPVDIRRLVHDMVELIGATLGPTIDVQVELESDLPPARADQNQLEMALLNLAVNARDAMLDGGELTIRAARESLCAPHLSGLKPGHYVRLVVGDTGAGMDEDTRRRAIEPFFSTKGIGKGTGLGLSMVHGLASQLGGGMTIDSVPEKGTTVELWLPVSGEPLGGEGKEAVSTREHVRRGTALLVDDEELVRMSTADMLADLGFEVTEASSAEEALHLIQHGAAPDLLVTDHLMPGMSGAELARAVHVSRPDLPVLLVSGYAEVEGIAPELSRLTKPFRRTELAEIVSALIPDGPG